MIYAIYCKLSIYILYICTYIHLCVRYMYVMFCVFSTTTQITTLKENRLKWYWFTESTNIVYVLQISFYITYAYKLLYRVISCYSTNYYWSMWMWSMLISTTLRSICRNAFVFISFFRFFVIHLFHFFFV